MKIMWIVGACLLLGACGKLGISGELSQAIGNWVEVKLPPNCVAKSIAAENGSGVAVLCEDGRVFH